MAKLLGIDIPEMDVKAMASMAFYFITDSNVSISEVSRKEAENIFAYRLGEAQSNSHIKIISQKKTENSEELIVDYGGVQYRIGYCPLTTPQDYYYDQI